MSQVRRGAVLVMRMKPTTNMEEYIKALEELKKEVQELKMIMVETLRMAKELTDEMN